MEANKKMEKEHTVASAAMSSRGVGGGGGLEESLEEQANKDRKEA